MAKRARAKLGEHTLNAELDDANEFVQVWVSNGPVLGMYRLERFANGTLTDKSLADLFTPKDNNA